MRESPLVFVEVNRNIRSNIALAAGHLREAECSSALRNGQIDEFVAFDQDEASLEVIERDYAHLGIRTMPGSVRQILAGKVNPVQFDFVYAAGLYDYLSAPVASAFTRRIFDMTRPGGQILIPNFRTGVLDSGYMESFMDWHLIYRNHDDSMRPPLPSTFSRTEGATEEDYRFAVRDDLFGSPSRPRTLACLVNSRSAFLGVFAVFSQRRRVGLGPMLLTVLLANRLEGNWVTRLSPHHPRFEFRSSG